MLDKILRLITEFPGQFLQGALMTLLIAALTVLFGVLLGSLICLMKRSKIGILRGIASGYVELIRGTPLLLQLYIFYFGLPELVGADLPKLLCVVAALVVNSSAYVAEIIRSGIQAVDKGQMEAARSLGLSGKQAMIRIIMPQAVRNILPALCNEFITVVKESSLGSTFFVGDLMTVANTMKGSLFMVIEPLIVCAVIYFIMTFTLSKLVAVLERRMARGE